MCNLYNVTTNQQAIRDFISIACFREGNLPPSINVHPDREGPIIRMDSDGERADDVDLGHANARGASRRQA